MADEAWTKYIDILSKTLNQQKERDIASMDSKLAARGIAKGGAYGAGITDISGRYADALAQQTAQIELEKAKLEQVQNFDLQKQQELFKMQKEKDLGYPTGSVQYKKPMTPAFLMWGPAGQSTNSLTLPRTNTAKLYENALNSYTSV